MTTFKSFIVTLKSRPKVLYFLYFFFLVIASLRWLNITAVITGTDLENWEFWNGVSSNKLWQLFIISPVQGLGGYSTPFSYWLNPALTLSYMLSGLFNPLVVVRITTLILENLAILFICQSLNIKRPYALVVLFLNFFITNSSFNIDWSFYVFEHLSAISFLRVIVLCMLSILLNPKIKNSWFLVFLVLVLFLYGMLFNPMYMAIYMLYPVFFYTIYTLILFLKDFDKKILYKFLFVILAILFITSIFGFLLSVNSARNVFGAETYSEVQRFDYLNSIFFRPRFLNILLVGMTLFSIIVLLKKDKQSIAFNIALLANLGLAFAVGILYTFSGIIWKYPSPVYLEQAFIPLLLIPVGMVLANNDLSRYRIILACSVAILVLAIILTKMPPVDIYNSVKKKVNNIFFKSKSIDIPAPAKASASTEQSISAFLKDRLDYRKGYNGSVSTLVGIPGSPVGLYLGHEEKHGYSKIMISEIPDFLRKKYDKDLYMTGLWRLNIPTMEDNNHIVSPFKYYFFSRLLSRPQDFQSRNFLIETKFDKNIYRLLGVRYVVTDYSLDLKLIRKISNEGIDLNLFEIDSTNLGSFYPTSIKKIKDAREFVDIVRKEDPDFRHEAFIHKDDFPEIDAKLIPGRTEKFGFVDVDKFVFKASTDGASLVILPIEFRNMLKVSGKGLYKLIRVNLFLTGIYFKGNIEVEFSSYPTLYSPVKLLEDRNDQKTYDLHSDGEVPYPSGYQPYSLFSVNNN